MKRLLFTVLLTAMATAVFALEPGKHYDFYQSNGQNVLGAELIAETDTEYTVKLKYVPKPIIIHRNSLAKPVELSKIQPVPKPVEPRYKLQPDFVFFAHAGYAYLTFGQLNTIFRNGMQAQAGADWIPLTPRFWHLHALTLSAGFATFSDAARRLQFVSLTTGPRLVLYHFEKYGIAAYASPLAGLAFTSLRGYTFSADYTVFTAIAAISLEKSFGRLTAGVQLNLNYLFDSSVSFSSTGINASVAYRL